MTNKEAKATIEIFYEQILKELWLTNEQRNGLAEALDKSIEALEKMDLIKFNVYALNDLLREADNEQ